MKRIILILTLVIGFFSACKKEKAEELAKPSIENLEIGINNNEIGVVGRDFHFNADVLAGQRIELVQIRIQQRKGENYVKPWSHVVSWVQYKGVKNTTVHKHFNIPNDAEEGKYDFIVIVTDENGTKLELKRNITIYAAHNLPIDPVLDEVSISARTNVSRVLYILSRGGYRDPISLQYGNYQVQLNKNEALSAAATISGIKGDGKIYVLLINKKHQHRPESINDIDFAKAIVVDVFEHTNMEQTDKWSHVRFDRANFPEISRLLVGALSDNNYPSGNLITGQKTWETGTYYVGFIYQNSSFKMGLYHYVEIYLNMG